MLADLTRRVATEPLTQDEITSLIAALLDSSEPDSAKAGLLRAWAQRGEMAAELAASAEALLPHAADPGVRGRWKGLPLLDCCGTGGGGLNLLNVSTGIVFILAALGVPVVKHGNRGLTKKSGSADVLEALGIRIDLPPQRIPECLDHVGAAFLFAPAFHISFAVLGPVRKRLAEEGQRTVFNLLGPLLNPARPEARLVGVFKDEHVELYRDALLAMACPLFAVVCGEDGPSGRKIGEVSAQGPTRIEARLGSIKTHVTLEENHRLDTPHDLETLFVRDAADSARRLLDLLSGAETGLARETLVINAAVAAWAHGTANSLAEGRRLAAEALHSGAAHDVLRRWQEFSS